MKKHIVVLGIMVTFVLVTGLAYKNLVLDHDFSSAKVIYQEKHVSKTSEFELINVYVPNKEFKKLEQKAVKIKKTDNKNEKIRLVFDEIKEASTFEVKYIGDDKKEVVSDYLDRTIRILNIYFDGKNLYLNFNYKLQSSIKTKEQELMLLYSIVNTYTSFADVDKVKILVNNEEVNSLKYYNISGFLEKDLSI